MHLAPCFDATLCSSGLDGLPHLHLLNDSRLAALTLEEETDIFPYSRCHRSTHELSAHTDMTVTLRAFFHVCMHKHIQKHMQKKNKSVEDNETIFTKAEASLPASSILVQGTTALYRSIGLESASASLFIIVRKVQVCSPHLIV